MSPKPIFLLALLSLLPHTGIAASAPLHKNCTAKVAPLPDSCAADFTVTDLQGKSVAFSQLAGKVILLHFWATWCEPCRDELPTLVKLHQRLSASSNDVVIVAVSLDTAAPEVKRFFKDKLPEFRLWLDPKQTSSTLYGSFKIPESYIIDRTGVVRDKIVGSRDWDDALIAHYLQLLAGGKRY